jgi:HNH endonuclease
LPEDSASKHQSNGDASMSKRKPTKRLPSVEYLRQCFSCDPDIGTLVWKKRPRNHFPISGAWNMWNVKYENKAAGWMDIRGYPNVSINRYDYKVHRIIWKMVTGREPPSMLDHKDGNRANNCFANLRTANAHEQSWNRGVKRTNTSGRRGVSQQKGKWKTSIYMGGVRTHLGYFPTVEAASAAYEAAARKLHGAFYRRPQEG